MKMRANEMAAHLDILEEHESLRKPFLVSIGLHASVFALLAMQGLIGAPGGEPWGNPDSLGGSSVGITPVRQIPLPSRGGIPNPLASDTESRVPRPPKPKPQARAAVKPDPSAVAIKSRTAAPKRARSSAAHRRSQPQPPESRGQLYSDTGRALSSAMVGQTGRGGVGVGSRGAFGTRFGYYRAILEQKVAEKWRTQEVDPRLQTAPPVIVTFVIRRNGSTANVRIEQSSGDKALDYSALRAIYEASPFPPLPAGYERDEASTEIWFELRR